MARRVFENQMKVFWDNSDVEDLSAPTAQEINDATELTSQITADGVQFNFNNNTASVDMIAEGKIEQLPGTRGLTVTLTAVRDDEQDDFWDEFEYGVQGTLIIAPFGDPEEGDSVYVIKGAPHEPQPLQSAANTFQQAEVEFAAVDWDLQATVSA